ncbi:MAG: AEC family transporter [Coriobacteriia bacterium]|nr:AEC family transporter [Coriobacteriia bacterium]
MDTFLNAGSTMVILFIIVSCGFVARKLHWTDDKFDAGLTKLIMNISCPALILDSVLGNTNLPDAPFILNILIISIVAYAGILILAWVAPKIYRAPRESLGAHQFTIAFGNTGFIGFAVVGAIIGSNAVLYASMYNIVFNLVIFSFGAYFVQASGSVKLTARERLTTMISQLRSPAMIACFIALVLALLGITDLDGMIGRTCDMLGAMTPPASMLVIGSTLAKYNFGEMFGNWRIYPTALLRLLAVPALFYFIGSFFTTDTYMLGVLALENGMPAAALGTMFCLTYGGDLKTMSQGMFVTTILSVVTIPLVTLALF